MADSSDSEDYPCEEGDLIRLDGGGEKKESQGKNDNSKKPSKKEKKRPQKKKNKPNKKSKKAESSEEGSSDEVDDEDGEEGGVVNVDFGFYDPKDEIDFHTIKLLCRNYVDVNKGELDTSGLADLIVNQVYVGTTIKNDGADNQPLGFITGLSLHHHKGQQCIKQIKDFLLRTCPPKHKQTMSTLLDDSKRPLGLLIHNRLVNLPIEVVPPLHSSLLADIEWCVENPDMKKEKNEERKALDFENLILIGRAYTSDKAFVPQETHEEQKGGGKKKKKASTFGSMPAHGFFKFFEEDFYHAVATLSYHSACKVPEKATEMEKLPQNYVVMVIKRKDLPAVHSQINQAVGLPP